MPIYFNQKKVASVYIPWLVQYRQRRLSLCVFIDETWMDDDEGGHFGARRSRVFWKMSRLPLDAALPIEPYYVAILVALAQDVVARMDKFRGERPRSGVTSIPVCTLKLC